MKPLRLTVPGAGDRRIDPASCAQMPDGLQCIRQDDRQERPAG